MKRPFLILLFLIPLHVFAQSTKIDSVAILILDRMSDVIGDLNSCSYNLSTATDVLHDRVLVKEYSEHEVLMVGPDKMQVQTKGDKLHNGFWYNGSHVVYYSYIENNFAVIDAPKDILSTMDSLNKKYNIDFPAADFFYPSFTDDLLDAFKVSYLGNKKINGKDCFHILAYNASTTLQIWISNDALTLPLKFVITDKQREQSPQYEATFSDWKLNPQFPESIFEFITPPGARKINILPKFK